LEQTFSLGTPLSAKDLKYWTFILTNRLILVVVFSVVNIKSYHLNLVAKQFSVMPPAIFLHNKINFPLHRKGNAKVLNVLEILEKHGKIISESSHLSCPKFFPVLTIIF
jgi:hypothetical protein